MWKFTVIHGTETWCGGSFRYIEGKRDRDCLSQEGKGDGDCLSQAIAANWSG